MELLNLPNDVLREILQACDKSSLVNFSQSSSQAQASSLPHLLRDIYLVRGTNQITSFLSQIIPQQHATTDETIAGQRAAHGMHVRTLEIAHPVGIDGRPDSDEQGSHDVSWGDRLSIALIEMPNLRSITLVDTGRLFDTSPVLVKTLMSMPHLNHIHLADVHRLAAGQQMSEAFSARHGQMHLERIQLELKWIQTRPWIANLNPYAPERLRIYLSTAGHR